MTRTEKFVKFFNSRQITGGVYPGSDKKVFALGAKAALKELAGKTGITDYDLRFNEAGPACSGEVTLHAENFYIQIGDTCMGKQKAVLFRTCKGKRDYSGGTNNFTSVDAFLNGKLRDWIKTVTTPKIA